LLHEIDDVRAEAEHPPGGGPGAIGVNPRRVQTLYSRIIGAYPDEAENWAFEARAVDGVIEEKVVNGVIVRPRSEPRFDFDLTMRIPTAELPIVYERLDQVAMELGQT
jgi:hypothetical protein